MSTAELNEVEIENIGPIEKLTLTAKPGTITVLTGPNGVGKTQALEAVAGLVSGKSRLSSRDGTTGGTARGFGVQIKVGRGGSNRRSGDLEIESVEDQLNIAHLVDPGLKDPVASDARRIKALVSLAGVEATPELFYHLAGGKVEFLEVVKPSSIVINEADVVGMASAVKRDFESASRKEAAVSENLAGEIRVREVANEGIDVDVDHDADELQAALELSLSNLAAEKQRADTATTLIAASAKARSNLEKCKAEYDGPAIGDAAEALGIIDSEVLTQQQHIDDIRQKLVAATEGLKTIEHRRELADSALYRAQEHAELIAGWEESVKAAENVEPTDDDTVITLAHRVDLARDAIETGVRVRDAIERQRVAELLAEQMKLATLNSSRLRDAAHGIEDVLSRLVAEMGGPFTVDKEFRLVVQHPKRGATYFGELSQGERWDLAIDVVIEAFKRIGRRGLLAIPQPAWEGLDADNQQRIANHIKDTDLAIITGEASREKNAGSDISVKTFE